MTKDFRKIAGLAVLIFMISLVQAGFGHTAPAKPSMPYPVSPGAFAKPGPALDTLTPELAWNPVSGAQFYAVTVNEQDGNRTAYKNLNVKTTRIKLPPASLEWGKKYWWTVLAYNSAGANDGFKQMYFQTAPLAKPGKPAFQDQTLPTAPGPVLATLMPTLRWTPVKMTDSYMILIYDCNSGLPGTVVFSKAGITDTSLQIPTGILLRGTKYYAVLTASNKSGDTAGANSYFQTSFPSPASVSSRPAVPVPQSPVDGMYLDTLTPVLVWRDSPGAESYRVLVKQAATGKTVYEIQQVRGTSVTLPANSLVNEQKYTWVVSAFNRVGWSDLSRPFSFDTPAFKGNKLSGPPAPLSPGGVSGPGPTITGLTPVLSWSPVPNASFYSTRIIDADTGQTFLKPQPTSGTSITAPPLQAGKKYSWSVQASMQLGLGGVVDSDWSKPLYFQTQAGSKTYLPELTGPGAENRPGTVLGTRTPSLGWKMVKDVYYFQVYVYDITDVPNFDGNLEKVLSKEAFRQDYREVWRYQNGQPVKPLLSLNVPANILKPGRTYVWGVGAIYPNYTVTASKLMYFQVQ